MKDPHVESLKYKVQTSPNVSYDNPPPVEIGRLREAFGEAQHQSRRVKLNPSTGITTKSGNRNLQPNIMRPLLETRSLPYDSIMCYHSDQ